MASPAENNIIAFEDESKDSDYGSDFSPEEEQIVERLLAGAFAIEDNPIVHDIEYNGGDKALRLPTRVLGREQLSPLFEAARAAERASEQFAESVKTGQHWHPDLSYQFRPTKSRAASEDPPAEPQEPQQPKEVDTRSPLLRFRTQPKKALSVTDLVSPAWCELQYWYTLTKHGKKKQTPAMRQGSVVHKVLEEQIHTTVKVEIHKKEDAWGLQIWNVIQGLRTLRETGRTRELQVWGVFDGLVVNGIIDDLSYICPDAASKTERPTILETLSGTGKTEKIYICDVKTRSAASLPNDVSFRPTRWQLMLYHRMLSNLASNQVDFSLITSRYGLSPLTPFSDTFVAQVGSLNDDVFDEPGSTNPSSDESLERWSQDSMSTLFAYNSLSALWSLMIMEFQTTFPNGKASVGNILQAEYRSSRTSEVMGSKTFDMDDAELDTYIKSEMQWWNGEREAQGVRMEEAFKCRSCDFADQCEWRLKKVDEATEKHRRSSKRKSAA